jgi:hypothetical protein
MVIFTILLLIFEFNMYVTIFNVLKFKVYMLLSQILPFNVQIFKFILTLQFYRTA